MTDKEKAEEYAKSILHCELCTRCNGKQDKINNKCEQFHFLYGGYLAGLTERRKNCMTVQNAMEIIKQYCKEITDENNNCSKCVFCSKGFNGCKLQRAPCEWE